MAKRKTKQTAAERLETKLNELVKDFQQISADKRQPAWLRGQTDVLQLRIKPICESLKSAINQNKAK